MEIIAIVVSLLGLLVSAALAVRVLRLETRLASAARVEPVPSAISPGVTTKPNPLDGLRVGLAITQDHPHAPFMILLKDHLLREDVADVVTSVSSECDILIEGSVVCNGYAEIYYDANFACSAGGRPICTLIEKPPHGDRPVNLVNELIGRLKSELEKALVRRERQEALSELRGI